MFVVANAIPATITTMPVGVAMAAGFVAARPMNQNQVFQPSVGGRVS